MQPRRIEQIFSFNLNYICGTHIPAQQHNQNTLASKLNLYFEINNTIILKF